MIRKITKPIRLKYTKRIINLPEDLNEKIKKFWNTAIEETPTLYNGEDFSVEDIEETEKELVIFQTTIMNIKFGLGGNSSERDR